MVYIDIVSSKNDLIAELNQRVKTLELKAAENDKYIQALDEKIQVLIQHACCVNFILDEVKRWEK